jgi:hypothetical protein
MKDRKRERIEDTEGKEEYKRKQEIREKVEEGKNKRKKERI